MAGDFFPLYEVILIAILYKKEDAKKIHPPLAVKTKFFYILSNNTLACIRPVYFKVDAEVRDAGEVKSVDVQNSLYIR
ncbi:MAG: hypothetical protein SAK29_04260 [Scytonema sp. PMC 1069.18]|nr:hypothetical protein [Scytonema sp. PMC 1069.18]MEC4886624.1 hypothetical protein [Scytonema sp. PMC 1070.18]